MENIKAKIIILSYLKFDKKDKNTGEVTPMTRIEYAFAEPQDSKKFVGFTTISGFYNGHEIFDRMSKGLLLRPLDAEFSIKEDYYDPNKLRRMLVKINGISLL